MMLIKKNADGSIDFIHACAYTNENRRDIIVSFREYDNLASNAEYQYVPESFDPTEDECPGE